MSDNEMRTPNPGTSSTSDSALATPVTPASTSSYRPGERPAGITIIAILAFLQGLLGSCVGCFIIAGSGLVTLVPTGVTQVVGVLGILLGVVLAAGPLLHLVFAYGAWNLRSWAWLLGIIATGVAVVGVVISIVGSGGATIWAAITNALIPIIVFVYLLMPDTRKAFYK